MGTRLAATKPKSICTVVNMMNQRFRWPSLSSPVDSAQATLPAGYSPLDHRQPRPRMYCPIFPHPMPIPMKKRHAAKAANRPPVLPPAPYEPAERAAKTNRMIVDIINAHFLDQWSLSQPK